MHPLLTKLGVSLLWFGVCAVGPGPSADSQHSWSSLLGRGSLGSRGWAVENAEEQDFPQNWGPQWCTAWVEQLLVCVKTFEWTVLYSGKGLVRRGILQHQPISSCDLAVLATLRIRWRVRWVRNNLRATQTLQLLTLAHCYFFIITRTPGMPNFDYGKSWQKVHSLELWVVFFSHHCSENNWSAG